MKISDVDMRDAFFDELYNIAVDDSRVIFLTADMGAFSLVRFKKDLPKQYINVGVAEQNMVSVAAGLALSGKTAFVYTIVPFATMRCYEQIKVDLCCMNLPVTVIGIGAGFTYGSDGPTHHATQDIAVMRTLPEITILNPSDSVMTQAFVKIAYKSTGPVYVRIEKGKLPLIYDEVNSDFLDGIAQTRKGSDLNIVSTGIMVHKAHEVAEILSRYSISVGVVDLYRIKPLNTELLLKYVADSKSIVTLEENSATGGIGSAVAEALSDNVCNKPLKRLAIPDIHCFESGERELLHACYGLDTDSIVKSIVEWHGEICKCRE